MRSKIDDITIGILYGGETLEGQVSILTAKTVLNSLSSQGFNVVDIDIRKPEFLSRIISVGAVFNCLHGEIGEDGKIQGLLEVLRKPYSGSGVFANALCRDKVNFKNFIRGLGFLTPDYLSLQEPTDLDCLEEKLTCPFVVKPRQCGGGIGIQKLESSAEVKHYFKIKSNSSDYFIEEFISGKILTVGIIEINRQIICSPVIEIILPEGKDIYDFDAKVNSKAIFALFTDKIAEEVRKAAMALHKKVYCLDFSRVDFILHDEKIYILEINTIPSLFDGSSYRFSMEQLNIYRDDLCCFILNSALSRFGIQSWYSKQLQSFISGGHYG